MRDSVPPYAPAMRQACGMRRKRACLCVCMGWGQRGSNKGTRPACQSAWSEKSRCFCKHTDSTRGFRLQAMHSDFRHAPAGPDIIHGADDAAARGASGGTAGGRQLQPLWHLTLTHGHVVDALESPSTLSRWPPALDSEALVAKESCCAAPGCTSAESCPVTPRAVCISQHRCEILAATPCLLLWHLREGTGVVTEAGSNQVHTLFFCEQK